MLSYIIYIYIYFIFPGQTTNPPICDLCDLHTQTTCCVRARRRRFTKRSSWHKSIRWSRRSSNAIITSFVLTTPSWKLWCWSLCFFELCNFQLGRGNGHIKNTTCVKEHELQTWPKSEFPRWRGWNTRVGPKRPYLPQFVFWVGVFFPPLICQYIYIYMAVFMLVLMR
jgi:hypothetical protein